MFVLVLLVAAALLIIVIIMVMMLMIMVVMTAAASFLIIVMVMVVFMFMVVAVAFSILVVVMMLVVMIMVVTAALLIIVMVMVVVLMVMMMVVSASAAALLSIVVMVIVVVAVTFHMLVDLVEQSAVVHCVVHPVLELVFVDIEHCAHECEIDPLLGIQISVLLDTVRHVGEVVCDSGTVIEGHSGLDVPEHRSGLLLDPFSDLDHGACEPCFRIRVPAADPSGDACCASSGLFKRCLLSAHFIIP